MKFQFDKVLCDCTKFGTKIPTNEYLPSGRYPIIDQGQKQIAGYYNSDEGLFSDVPAIIFGDHTRTVKYVDQPCFLGADGVKLLCPVQRDSSCKYLFYQLQNAAIPNTGYNRHYKWVKELYFTIPDKSEQERVVNTLDKTTDLISLRKQQIAKLDELVKSQFIEMFGDPISDEKSDAFPKLGAVCGLRAGKFIKANDIYEQYELDLYPCYGGNGIRGYVVDYNQEGEYPLVGRQGALCGNVQFATGRFYATEHAVVVTSKVEMDRYWLYFLLFNLQLNRYASGAAQPGLAVSKLENIHVCIPSLESQIQFSSLAKQTDKSKFGIQKSLNKLETLKKALMQQYFG